jgi:hypothetical protein
MSGGWAYWGGTSFSAPLVSGMAALLLSAQSDLSVEAVGAALTESARDLGAGGWDADFGWGLVDAEAALQAAGQTTTSSTTTTTSTTTTSTTSTTSSTSTTTTTTPSSTTSTTAPPTTTTTERPHFADVSAHSSPYYAQIERLAALGVVVGKNDGNFYPRDKVLRQQFAKMVILALGLGGDVSEEDECPFTDVMNVRDDLYPYHYVAVAWQQGITQGTSAQYFSPYRDLTRAQLITMIARGAALPEPPADYDPGFPMFSSAHYASARRAAYAGILDGLIGMGPAYDFLASATREEVCALLYELVEQ